MPHQADGAESSGDLSSHLVSSRQPQISSGMDRRTHQREGDICATRGFTLARGTVPRPLERYHLGGRRRKHHNVSRL